MNLYIKSFKTLILKTAVISAITVANCNLLKAEGYQVNSLSVRQLGMGYTGVAMKLGSESIHYNPGALAYMPNMFDFSVGVSGIKSEVKYESTDRSYKAQTNNPLSTPFFAYVGYKPLDRLSFGLAVNTPAGNCIEWPQNWRGSYLIEKIDLKAFNFQPTVSYKIADFISIGAGLMIDFGSVNLTRSLIPVGGLDQLAALDKMFPGLNVQSVLDGVKGKNPVTANLKGTSKVGYGVNVGALINVTPKLSIGVSYRSKLNLNVKNGDADLEYADENLKGLIDKINSLKPGTVPIPPINEGSFEASLPLPSNLNIGLSYKFNDKLLVSGEVQYVGWKAYDSLKFQFDEKVLNGYSTVAPKKYKNTLIYRVGAEYSLSDFAMLRLGGYYDSTPVRSDLYNPETPGSNKIVITAGTSMRLCKSLFTHIGIAYINGSEKEGSYSDSVTHSSTKFSGYYKAHAWIGAIGLSWSL